MPAFGTREVRLADKGFSSRQAARLSGLTERQLRYWRDSGFLAPGARTPGGHARYSFTDLIALRTARELLDQGISLQRVRRCLESLRRLLPGVAHPLSEYSLVVAGEVILAIRGDDAFDVMSGQHWVLPIARFARDIETELGLSAPEQAELFPELREVAPQGC